MIERVGGDAPQDRRGESRRPASARGVVAAPGLELPCIIADVSAGGFRLRLERQVSLPKRVTVVDTGAALAHEVEIVWQKGIEAGGRRHGQASLRGLVPRRLAPARDAWLRAGGR